MKSELRESMSARSSIDTALSKCYSEFDIHKKLSESNSDCFRNKIKSQISKNNRRIKNLSSFMSEFNSDKEFLTKIRKEIAISRNDNINDCISKLTHSASTIFDYYEHTIGIKDAQILYLNGLRKTEELTKELDHNEEEFLSQYKSMEEDYRKHTYEKSNKHFEKSIKESDEMYFYTQNLMKELAEKCKKKNSQIKDLKRVISNKKNQLDILQQKSDEANKNLDIIINLKGDNDETFQSIKTTQLNLTKDVSRMMIEINNLQKHEKRLKDYINRDEVQKRQLISELDCELKEIDKIKQKLDNHSSAFIRNKRLSDSVNMDQSRLESFLSMEKETKQELLSVVNMKKKEIELYKRKSKEFVSKSFINPNDTVSSHNDIEEESSHSDSSQIIPDELSDYETENKLDMHQLEKEHIKSISGNTADDVTMATKRSAGHLSDCNDVRSLADEFHQQISDRKLESKRETARVDKEISEHDFVISMIPQIKHFEEIPEVPEEASSANITPRRPEDEQDDLANIEIVDLNQSPLFGILKLNNIKRVNKQMPINRFNNDKEISFSSDSKMNISIVSSVDSNPDDDYLISPNNCSNSNISFSSSNFKSKENYNNKVKPPVIPKLNLSKVKSPFENSRDIFSLNLSGISGNQSINESVGFNTLSCAKENKKCKIANIANHKRHLSTKVTLNNQIKKHKMIKEDKGLCDSFINDANVLTELIINNPTHGRKISNLDLTFEKNESQIEENSFKQNKLDNKALKDVFKKSHWNFGSKRNRRTKDAIKF